MITFFYRNSNDISFTLNNKTSCFNQYYVVKMTSPMRPINKNTLLKVVILGDGGVGKSCLMQRFVANQFDDNSFHTIGVEFLNRDIEIDLEQYTLQCWDTGGQERFRALRTPFYRGADICILTYAVNDRNSFKSLKYWRDEFTKYADIDGNNFPFIVVGNKNDIASKERQVSPEEVLNWCQEFHIVSFIETSAKTSENVLEAFVMAVRQWKKIEHSVEEVDGSAIKIGETPSGLRQNERTSCCSGTRDSPTRTM